MTSKLHKLPNSVLWSGAIALFLQLVTIFAFFTDTVSFGPLGYGYLSAITFILYLGILVSRFRQLKATSISLLALPVIVPMFVLVIAPIITSRQLAKEDLAKQKCLTAMSIRFNTYGGQPTEKELEYVAATSDLLSQDDCQNMSKTTLEKLSSLE